MCNGTNFSPAGEKKKRGRRRKLGPEDSVLAYLIKTRKDYSYMALGCFFGVAESTMSDACADVERCVSGELTDRLYHLFTKEEMMPHLSTEFRKLFPYCCFIGDGVPFGIKKSGNLLVQKITWSVYKHGNIYLFVICKFKLYNIPFLSHSLPYTVISPDGIVQMRTEIYGGRSGEVTTTLNKSRIEKCVTGKY